jgi:hypothetical protein
MFGVQSIHVQLLFMYLIGTSVLPLNRQMKFFYRLPFDFVVQSQLLDRRTWVLLYGRCVQQTECTVSLDTLVCCGGGG